MAGTLKDLVRAVQQDLPVTVRHETWMLANPDPVYSEAAIQFSDDFLRGKVGGKRENRALRFRASGMGKCGRRRIFTRINHPGAKENLTSTQANVYATGNVMHRKWQMAGLTEGWLTAAEVPMDSVEMDLAGTADGVIWDNSLLEFKTINERGFKWMTSHGEANEEHQLQVGAYKLLDPSLTAASVIYENKNTGDWREMRTHFTDELMNKVVDELELLHHALETHVLPPPLPPCVKQEGTEYRRCPFRDTCLTIKIWPKEKR